MTKFYLRFNQSDFPSELKKKKRVKREKNEVIKMPRGRKVTKMKNLKNR